MMKSRAVLPSRARATAGAEGSPRPGDFSAARSRSTRFPTPTGAGAARAPRTLSEIAGCSGDGGTDPRCVRACFHLFLPNSAGASAAWGFRFKTVALTWVKTTQSAPGLGVGDDKAWHKGLGYWSRGNPEQCLLFTRGSPRRLSASVRQLIVAPRREHSRKPDESYASIETLVPGPRLELFSRTPRDGWDSWGAQAERFAVAAE